MSSGLSTSETLLAVVVIALTTFLTRAGLIVAGDRVRLSHTAESALRFAPACALAALVVPEILFPMGTLDLSLDNPRWPAALAATLLLLRHTSVTGAIALGMTVYAIVRGLS